MVQAARTQRCRRADKLKSPGEKPEKGKARTDDQMKISCEDFM
jgi:hypothetical protein